MQSASHLPSISVVIPSFNQGQYLEETLVSVLGQQYPKLEVIVIDGGSADNSVEILQAYSSQLAYWHSRPDKGQADAINQGMRRSSGDILCWINSDDMYLPGALLDVGRRLAPHIEQPFLVYGDAMTITHGADSLRSSAQRAGPFDAFRLTYTDFIVQPSAFWTRSLWAAAGELDLAYRYALDWDWFIRASQFADFCYVSKFYSVYRIHPAHKTGTGAAARQKEILTVVQRYSSAYWNSLYTETLAYYPHIREFLNLLIVWRVPKPTVFLLLRFPELILKLKQPRDIHAALQMYG
jgi:glycosyltransferase involved in cell wall biosynthesis